MMSVIETFGTESGLEIFKSEFAKKFTNVGDGLRRKFFESLDKIYKNIKENIDDEEKVAESMKELQGLGTMGKNIAYDMANGGIFTILDDDYEIIIKGRKIYVYKSTEYQIIDGREVPVIPQKFIKKKFRIEGVL